MSNNSIQNKVKNHIIQNHGSHLNCTKSQDSQEDLSEGKTKLDTEKILFPGKQNQQVKSPNIQFAKSLKLDAFDTRKVEH